MYGGCCAASWNVMCDVFRGLPTKRISCVVHAEDDEYDGERVSTMQNRMPVLAVSLAVHNSSVSLR
jgi:hypothetical protein